MKIKCKISDLETICRLTSLKGKNIDGKDYRAIMDCLMTASTGKLSIQAMDIQHSFAIKLDYSIAEILEEGPLAVGDIEIFEKFLQRFNPDDVVTVSTEGNKILIEREAPKKSARLPLADISSINSKDAPPIANLEFSKYGYPKSSKMYYNLSMIIDADAIKSIFEDGNLVKQRIIPWKIKDSKLSVAIGGEQGSFESEVALAELQNDPEKPGLQTTATAFGNGLDNIFANLTGKIKIYLADEVEVCPLAVAQETDKYKFFALLAPYVISKD